MLMGQLRPELADVFEPARIRVILGNGTGNGGVWWLARFGALDLDGAHG